MKKYSILLVDDTPQWLRHHINLLHQIYNSDELELETANSAYEGFIKAVNPENKYDLIITDLEMEEVEEFQHAGEWLIHYLINNNASFRSKLLIISGSYNIADIAKRSNVEFIPKSELLSNPLLLKYKIEEMIEV